MQRRGAANDSSAISHMLMPDLRRTCSRRARPSDFHFRFRRVRWSLKLLQDLSTRRVPNTTPLCAAQSQSHDFVADNRRKIAAIEAEALQRKALSEMPASPPKHAAIYEHVTSRLAAAGVCVLMCDSALCCISSARAGARVDVVFMSVACTLGSHLARRALSGLFFCADGCAGAFKARKDCEQPC